MEVPRHWRTQASRYALMGVRCEACGALTFPPREVCPECRGGALQPHRFCGLGEVYSHSTVLQGPDGFADGVPYVVALVKLDEGPLVAAQLTDIDREQVAIGLRVEMVTRRLRDDGPHGIVLYGYKFRPVLGGREAGT